MKVRETTCLFLLLSDMTLDRTLRRHLLCKSLQESVTRTELPAAVETKSCDCVPP